MAQANPNNVAALQPTTYREHYSMMPDVMNGTRRTSPCSDPSQGSNRQPCATAYFLEPTMCPRSLPWCRLIRHPRILFIHRPTRYAASLQGGQPWDDRVFGFQGDLLRGNQTNLVEWPDTPFLRITLTMVPQYNHMEAAWQAAGGADALGPYGANEPHTEQLRACSIIPIPHHYVPLCLTRSYTPRAFWTDVVGQIAQDQALQDCAVLVHWARVAYMYGLVGLLPNAAQPTVPLSIVGGLRVPLLDDALLARHWSWVLEDIPALGRTRTTLEQQFLQQNATLGNLLQRQVDDAAEA